jgi:sulfur-oxidizing protein SoxA
MIRVVAALAALMLVVAHAQQRAIPSDALRSGIAFSGPSVRSMQSDDAANPAMLWAERGERLWSEPVGNEARSCASCHSQAAVSMRGVASRYPVVSASDGTPIDLESRINACRTERQGAARFPREAEDLLALTAYVALQSRGMPVKVSIDGPARAAFERGRAFYYTRQGQMNLSCAQCHEQNWGRRLLAETISQGHGNAYPAYRVEWQALGSLDRRLRSCLFGIRAEMPPAGAPELLDLALFLAWRGEGLPLEAPGVRR